MEPEGLYEKNWTTGPLQINTLGKKIIFMHVIKSAIWQFVRKADMALLNPFRKIKKFWGQMYLFVVVNNSPL